MSDGSERLAWEFASEVGATAEQALALIVDRSQRLAIGALQEASRRSSLMGASKVTRSLAVVVSPLRSASFLAPRLGGRAAAVGSYWALRASLGALRLSRKTLAGWM